MSLCIDDRLMCRFGWDSSKPAHQTVIYTEWHIPDVVFIQTCTPNGRLYRVTYTRCGIHPNLHTKRSSIQSDIHQMSYSSKPAHQTVTYTEWHIPDVVFIQTCTPNGRLYRVTYTRCRIHPNLHTKRSSIQSDIYQMSYSSKPAHQTVIYTEWHIPDVVFIQTCTPNGHLYRVTYTRCRIHPNLHTKRSSTQSDIYQMSYSSKPAHQTVVYTEWHIPDVVFIQICTPNGPLYRVTYTRCRIHSNLHTKRSSIKSDIYQM